MSFGNWFGRLLFALCVVSFGSAAAAEQQLRVFLTGYSFWDNTPRGSTAIARPVVHRQAGGSGSYDDPITLAVGHAKRNGRSEMDFPAGTRFYFPRLKKYAIVEDLCGDGNLPQNGPCHSGYQGHIWLDIYVDGRRAGNGAANSCMRRITGIQTTLINPRAGWPVNSGPITESGCRTF